MPTVKMLRGGQVTIPAELRHALRLVEGVELLVTGNKELGLHLSVLPSVGSLGDLVGCLAPEGSADVDLEQARRETQEEIAARFEAETARLVEQDAPGRREQAAAHGEA